MSERGESGGGIRNKRLEALTVFSQRIQAREREKKRMGEEVKGGAGNPGTSWPEKPDVKWKGGRSRMKWNEQ